MNFDEDISRCVTVLQNGGLILYPTDNHWSVGCDATNAIAVSRIVKLLQYPAQKNMVILLADENRILDYVNQPVLRVFDYIKGLGKPNTVIYKGAHDVANDLIKSDGSVAIRIVTDVFCHRLLHRFDKPVVSVPARIRYGRKPESFVHLQASIKKGVDYIAQHRREDSGLNAPDSVIRWNTDGSLSILNHMPVR